MAEKLFDSRFSSFGLWFTYFPRLCVFLYAKHIKNYLEDRNIPQYSHGIPTHTNVYCTHWKEMQRALPINNRKSPINFTLRDWTLTNELYFIQILANFLYSIEFELLKNAR